MGKRLNQQTALLFGSLFARGKYSKFLQKCGCNRRVARFLCPEVTLEEHSREYGALFFRSLLAHSESAKLLKKNTGIGPAGLNCRDECIVQGRGKLRTLRLRGALPASKLTKFSQHCARTYAIACGF